MAAPLEPSSKYAGKSCFCSEPAVGRLWAEDNLAWELYVCVRHAGAAGDRHAAFQEMLAEFRRRYPKWRSR